MTFSTIGIFINSAFGGVIGAGLTHYVTNLRDRRTARAVIVERIASAEAEYAALSIRSGEIPSEGNLSFSKLNESLAAVEAARLVAGVPRANVMSYIISRSLGTQVSSFRSIVSPILDIIDQRKQAIKDGALDDKSADIDKGLHLVRELQSILDGLEKVGDALNVIAIDELGRSVWHPFVVQFRRRRLYRLQRRLHELEMNLRTGQNAFKEIKKTIRNLPPINTLRLAGAEQVTPTAETDT